MQYVMWPSDIDQWNREEDHFFYLEVFGETSPTITSGCAHTARAMENESPNHNTDLAPLYEYFWSIGFVDLDRKCGPETWGGELADTAAEVYLYFPTTGGWRIKELLATIKYLCPAAEHSSLLQEAADLFATAQPIIEDASKLAAIGSGLPEIGPVAASAATLLDVLAKLKITSVPPSHDYKWSVQKVTEYKRGEGLLHGVKWTIPKKLFIEFGARLTGSIALNVIPTSLQLSSAEPVQTELRRLPIRARANMHLHPRPFQRREPSESPIRVPREEFLELEIEPRVSGN
jgi:hypothetical protein